MGGVLARGGLALGALFGYNEATMSLHLTRRDFLKGLGALAALALPACRRAQEFAVAPESCPEWMRAGEASCFASSIPWATGALPLLAVCHEGRPTALQALPQAPGTRGLPAWAQASLLDLYDGGRPAQPSFNGKPFPMRGLRGAMRGWAAALREEARVAFLLPQGWSPLREAQVAARDGRRVQDDVAPRIPSHDQALLAHLDPDVNGACLQPGPKSLAAGTAGARCCREIFCGAPCELVAARRRAR